MLRDFAVTRPKKDGRSKKEGAKMTIKNNQNRGSFRRFFMHATVQNNVCAFVSRSRRSAGSQPAGSDSLKYYSRERGDVSSTPYGDMAYASSTCKVQSEASYEVIGPIRSKLPSYFCTWGGGLHIPSYQVTELPSYFFSRHRHIGLRPSSALVLWNTALITVWDP